jgi:manganese transport protein
MPGTYSELKRREEADMARISKKGGWGPGFLVTAAFIGPGTVTTCTLAGAQFGFSLIWALVFATLATVILQEMAGRLALGSKMNLAEALRAYPRSSASGWGFILLTIAAITFGCTAYEAGNIIGGSLGLQIISGLDRQVWGAIISAVAVIILSLKGYRIIEVILITLVFIMSAAFIGTAIIIKPDIIGILKGTLPSFPANSLYLIIGLIGTTVVPYNLFLHSAAVKEKWKSKDALSSMRKDLWVAIPVGGLRNHRALCGRVRHVRGLRLERRKRLTEVPADMVSCNPRWLRGINHRFQAGGGDRLRAGGERPHPPHRSPLPPARPEQPPLPRHSRK